MRYWKWHIHPVSGKIGRVAVPPNMIHDWGEVTGDNKMRFLLFLEKEGLPSAHSIWSLEHTFRTIIDILDNL